MLLAAVAGAVLLGAQPALACGGLVGPGGTVQLARTTTLAGYHDGVEHYLTSFSYAGGGARFGSIVPLPGVPTDVRKGGEWTLQRLVRETQPQPQFLRAAEATVAADKAEELLTTRVDALDITVLRGGGRAVGDWAREHGFGLSVDAPEVLDFYAARSPIFMAASFDARRASARGQRLGDGTPIHLTIPTGNPWVPLRILGLGHQPADPIQADLYLLTDRRPALLPGPAAAGARGVALERSGPASAELLADLRADKGMGWLPGLRHVAQPPAHRLDGRRADPRPGGGRQRPPPPLAGRRRPGRPGRRGRRGRGGAGRPGRAARAVAVAGRRAGRHRRGGRAGPGREGPFGPSLTPPGRRTLPPRAPRGAASRSAAGRRSGPARCPTPTTASSGRPGPRGSGCTALPPRSGVRCRRRPRPASGRLWWTVPRLSSSSAWTIGTLCCPAFAPGGGSIGGNPM